MREGKRGWKKGRVPRLAKSTLILSDHELGGRGRLTLWLCRIGEPIPLRLHHHRVLPTRSN